MTNKSLLLVEDNDVDYEHTIRAFKKANFANPVYRCIDGDEALDYLFKTGEYAPPNAPPTPGVILLDLNLPGTDGRDVLQKIKQDDNLSQIPVIVLTTSTDENDIQRCYKAGANSYIEKPVGMDGFIKAIQYLRGFWFEISVLPKNIN